jgi:uncharacterized protein
MKFAVILEFTPREDRIAEVRPEHRKWLTKLRDQGKLVVSGPFTDGSGGLIVLEAASSDDAEALLKQDPYREAGIVKSWMVRPWNPVFANRDLLPS